MATPKATSPIPPSPRQSLPKFGFAGLCLLIGLVTFSIQQGCAVTGNAPSWIWGTIWFFVAFALIVLAIWFWDQTAVHHWRRKSILTALAFSVMGPLSFVPISREYRNEHRPKPQQMLTAAEIADEVAKKIPRQNNEHIQLAPESLPTVKTKGKMKVDRAPTAVQRPPEVLVLYKERQFEIHNPGPQTLYLHGGAYGNAKVKPDEPPAVIVPGAYYYLFAAEFEDEMKSVLQENQVGRNTFHAFISTENSNDNSKRYTIRCVFRSEKKYDAVSIDPQVLPTVPGWTDDPF